ncbi:hypothetical protein A3Q56_07390 [Intoshia linei]|uniref:Uncharacterized protein n=1 Tax=Intoshia linei TaxID=1819745 RepID=A0A177AU60_9BILA|nr:hypothetical protein A3Q56_07390 [Intoshia linei]
MNYSKTINITVENIHQVHHLRQLAIFKSLFKCVGADLLTRFPTRHEIITADAKLFFKLSEEEVEILKNQFTEFNIEINPNSPTNSHDMARNVSYQRMNA